MCFMEEASQFSVGKTAQSLNCSIMGKPHTGLEDCLKILQGCFRKRMSDQDKTDITNFTPFKTVFPLLFTLIAVFFEL